MITSYNDGGICHIYSDKMSDSYPKMEIEDRYICYGFADDGKDLSMGARCKDLVNLALNRCTCVDVHTVNYAQAISVPNTEFQKHPKSLLERMSTAANSIFVCSRDAIQKCTHQTGKDLLWIAGIIAGTVAAVYIYNLLAKDSLSKIADWKDHLGKEMPVSPLKWDASTKHWKMEILTESRLLKVTHSYEVQAMIMRAGAVMSVLLGTAFALVNTQQSELVTNYRDRYVSYFNEHSPKQFCKLVPIITTERI